MEGNRAYYDVIVNGETVRNGAWYYPDTKPAADRIENYVAFYKARFEIED